jgi:hypothetical protein
MEMRAGYLNQAVGLAALLVLPAPATAAPLRVSLFGDMHYSRYDFTDIPQPYDGLDGSAVLRAAWSPRGGNRVGLLGDATLVGSSYKDFFWQRYVQLGVGIQGYPFKAPNALRSVRATFVIARRGYYGDHGREPLETADVQAGLDYYYDNLFEERRMAVIAYTAAGYRRTNFSLPPYDAFLWSGNVKLGRMTRRGRSTIAAYGVADWTYVPTHPDRFWENFLRIGAGARWQPAARHPTSDLARGFNVYAEVLHNVWWLKAPPRTSSEANDVRIGIGFSAGSLFGRRQ